jgi:hypothetical protein
LDAEHFVITPKQIQPQHFLAKELLKKSRSFNLARTTIDLKPTSENVAAAATTFKLSPQAARRLGRPENLIEAAAAPIEDAASIKAIRASLKSLNVPTAESPSTAFYVLEARRRVPGQVLTRDLDRIPTRLRKEFGELVLLEHRTANEETLLLQFASDDKKAKVVIAGRFGAFTTYLSRATGSLAGDVDEDEDEREVEDHSVDSRQDFAQCYKGCMDEIPGWLLAVVGAACAACTGALALGTIPGTQPVTVPVLITACSACAVAVGIVLGNCLLTCHEMLGVDP